MLPNTVFASGPHEFLTVSVELRVKPICFIVNKMNERSFFYPFNMLINHDKSVNFQFTGNFGNYRNDDFSDNFLGFKNRKRYIYC